MNAKSQALKELGKDLSRRVMTMKISFELTPTPSTCLERLSGNTHLLMLYNKINL